VTNLGLILTSAPDLDALRQHVRGLDALKCVTGWGLPWTDELRREAARLCPTLVVRTVTGDPSYDGGRFALPDANAAIAELEPWYAAWQKVATPAQRILFEVGNEPLIGPPGGEASLTPRQCYEYADILAQTIIRLTARFPLAQVILPAQLLNPPLRVGPHAHGQAWMTEIMARALQTRGVLPLLRQRLAVGLHAYTESQFEEGRALAAQHFPGLPVWVTEFAVNREMPPEVRGALYARMAAAWGVAGVLVYHLDMLGGTDPAHFLPNYRVTRAVVEHMLPDVAAPFSTPPMADTIAYPQVRIDGFAMDVRQWKTVAAFRAHLANYRAATVAPWAQGVVVHHTVKPVAADWRGAASMLALAKFYRDSSKWTRGPHLFVASGAPDPGDNGIWQLTPLNLQGIHAGECNAAMWGMEVVGNYDAHGWPPDVAALAQGAAAALLAWKGLRVTGATVKGHRDCNSPKSCPGNAINLEAVRRGVGALV
jgi:hypothetical protein